MTHYVMCLALGAARLHYTFTYACLTTLRRTGGRVAPLMACSRVWAAGWCGARALAGSAAAEAAAATAPAAATAATAAGGRAGEDVGRRVDHAGEAVGKTLHGSA